MIDITNGLDRLIDAAIAAHNDDALRDAIERATTEEAIVDAIVDADPQATSPNSVAELVGELGTSVYDLCEFAAPITGEIPGLDGETHLAIGDEAFIRSSWIKGSADSE